MTDLPMGDGIPGQFLCKSFSTPIRRAQIKRTVGTHRRAEAISSLAPIRRAKSAGMRTARLLPHLEICRFSMALMDVGSLFSELGKCDRSGGHCDFL